LSTLDLIIHSLEDIKKDIREIRRDVKQINAFRWKLIGVATVVALGATLGGNIMLSYI
jgi:hypothetical protein